MLSSLNIVDPELARKLVQRGWTEVDRGFRLGPCWEWNGSRIMARGGYGRMRHESRDNYAHRLAYRAWNGEIPQGLDVLHKCDNPPCINPFHLFVGTRAENVYDMINKGRSPVIGAQGERHHHARLTVEQVVGIRKLAAEGLSSFDIGRRYGIFPSTVWKIRTRKAWKHV